MSPEPETSGALAGILPLQGEPPPDGKLTLSPRAIAHLPPEILDMLGSAALPQEMSGESGNALSQAENGEGQPISDAQVQALVQAIAPLAQAAREGTPPGPLEEEPFDGNPRSRLLKERMKAINERNAKRAARKKRQ